MRSLTIPLLALAVLVVGGASAQSADDIIGQAADSRYHGNTIQTIELTRTSRGKSTAYTLLTSTRVEAGLEQARAEFTAPTDLQGMLFLTKKVEGQDAENWMYMSAVDSLTHITGTDRTGAFMGTDFSYEDLEIGDVDAGTHVLAGQETITVAGSSYACHKVVTTPAADRVTGYGKVVTWVDQATFVPRQILLFQKDGTTEWKKMRFETWGGSAAGRRVPTRILMENLLRETTTLMEITDYRLDVPVGDLEDSLFDPDQLQAQ